MTRDEKIDLVVERFYNRYNKYNTKVLTKLGEIIKKFKEVEPSQSYLLAQELKNSSAVKELNDELSRITGKTINEVYELFDEIAREDLEFYKQYYEYENKEFKPLDKRKVLMASILGVSLLTSQELVNMTKKTGFTIKPEPTYITKNIASNITTKFKTTKEMFDYLVDKASYEVSRGTTNYETAVRKTIKQLANSGVKTIEYESGYKRRLDSSVRQAINDGVSRIFHDIQEQIGDELGTDGVEITAHGMCASDHLPYQGKQYSNKEFEKIQNSLDRPIEMWNCRHRVYRIILGVDNPSYTKEQLNEYKKNSLSPVEYDGKTYTKYEATQVQRKLETAIRRNKDEQIIARAADDKNLINKSQQKINELTRKYNDFSKKAGLQPYKERLSVSGYRRVKVK